MVPDIFYHHCPAMRLDRLVQNRAAEVESERHFARFPLPRDNRQQRPVIAQFQSVEDL